MAPRRATQCRHTGSTLLGGITDVYSGALRAWPSPRRATPAAARHLDLLDHRRGLERHHPQRGELRLADAGAEHRHLLSATRQTGRHGHSSPSAPRTGPSGSIGGTGAWSYERRLERLLRRQITVALTVNVVNVDPGDLGQPRRLPRWPKLGQPGRGHRLDAVRERRFQRRLPIRSPAAPRPRRWPPPDVHRQFRHRSYTSPGVVPNGRPVIVSHRGANGSTPPSPLAPHALLPAARLQRHPGAT